MREAGNRDPASKHAPAQNTRIRTKTPLNPLILIINILTYNALINKLSFNNN
jgi:hypothetical protein